MKEKINGLLKKMTLEEKASLCSGKDFWHLKGIDWLGIPEIMVSDGPNGLRKQEGACDHLGVNESVQAVCFPTGSALGASFDRELLARVGDLLGNECEAERVAVLLGPAVNMKRSPLCGRNFEYFSEDPYLTSELAAAEIQGIQKHKVGTSLKHFLANNQEMFRMNCSSEVDERTLHEIYLCAFENAVKKGKPWTIMSSYNKVNGEYVADSRYFLTEILREKWGFEGAVMTDWGGVSDRVKGLEAGLDLEMPSSHGVNDRRIVESVRRGTLSEEVLDIAVERILEIILKYGEEAERKAVFDRKEDHDKAVEIAEQCAVLLKNEKMTDGKKILPLGKEQNIAVIGQYAFEPRYQGGGSSHIHAYHVDSIREQLCDDTHVRFARGYMDEDETMAQTLEAEALELAAWADIVVLFAGLPDSYEIEGQDRKHMQMPKQQIRLIEKTAEINSNLVVVLHNGSPVEMPWIGKAKAVLEMYLAGEGCGKAACDLLYGKVNPSGRLAETFPRKLSENPSYLFYHKEWDKAEYREGIYTGYRYYTSGEVPVLFPFGHGLSYTTFAYSDLMLSSCEMSDTETIEVSVDVRNTGSCTGKEVVQLYVAPPDDCNVNRPVRELREFTKVELRPGEKKTVKFALGKRAFAYYETKLRDWYVEEGIYRIQICQSAEEVILEEKVKVTPEKKMFEAFNLTTPIGRILQDPVGQKILGNLIIPKHEEENGEAESEKEKRKKESGKQMLASMTAQLPLRALLSFRDMGVGHTELQNLIDTINRRREVVSSKL